MLNFIDKRIVCIGFNKKVDKKKLEKAQAKLQQKQDKRTEQVIKGIGTLSVASNKMDGATASQVTSKKEAKLEAKGNNRAQDIRIENFDVAYGDRYVQCSVFI